MDIYDGESIEDIEEEWIPVAERLFNLYGYDNNPSNIGAFISMHLTGCIGMSQDEYCYVRHTMRLCCGKEKGYMLLSKTGFLRHRKAIKERFLFLKDNLPGRSPEGTWEEFEHDVMKLFDDIVENSNKHVEQLNKKINNINECLCRKFM